METWLDLHMHTKYSMDGQFEPADLMTFTMNEYIDLCIRFLEQLKPTIGIERFISQSPKDLLIYPDWGVKNFEFIAKLQRDITHKLLRHSHLEKMH